MPTENEIFQKICREELLCDKERDSIGVYAEKRLHAVLKRFLYDDAAAFEKKVPERGGKTGRYVADILTPTGEIFEIQTGSLYPLARKIAYYLTETDLSVTLVHPLTAVKYQSVFDPETGEIVSRRKSPRHEGVLDGIALLKPFAEWIGHERFSVLFVSIEAEEYRVVIRKQKNGKLRTRRHELTPLSLVHTCRLQTKADLLSHLPADLPPRFTAKTFGKLTRLRGYALYDALSLFTSLGALCREGKEGRSTVFAKTQVPAPAQAAKKEAPTNAKKNLTKAGGRDTIKPPKSLPRRKNR